MTRLFANGVKRLALFPFFLAVQWAATPFSTFAEQDLCDRQPQLQAWLQRQAPAWQEVLVGKPGYERPESVIICQTSTGRSYADYAHNRIYLRLVEPQEDQLSLAHEYLHLAFQHHPRAYDEHFIEQTARELILRERHFYEPNNE